MEEAAVEFEFDELVLSELEDDLMSAQDLPASSEFVGLPDSVTLISVRLAVLCLGELTQVGERPATEASSSHKKNRVLRVKERRSRSATEAPPAV